MGGWRLVSALLTAVFLTTAAGAQGQPDAGIAEFIAGCVILSVSPDTAPQLRKKQFAGLAASTGLTPSQARRMVESYRDKPAEWNAVLKRSREIVEKLP